VLSFGEDFQTSKSVTHRPTDQWASMDYRNVFDLTGSVAVIFDMAVKRLVATGIDATLS
jgi:hypothetical protein